MANGTLKVSNIETSSGSGTITIGQSGETITIPSGATQTGIGGNNTPAFNAESTGTMSVGSGNTWTKVTNLTVENFDTDSAYDTSNQRFTVPSDKAGKYLISYGGQLNNSDRPDFILYKNGSAVNQTFIRGDNSGNTSDDNSIRGSVILDLAVADYLEIYARTNTASSTAVQNASFSGMRLIGA
tara:strand:+ start:92 stop:643 length:552 start_codon:yes stop_codon:yes gene_type:complete